MPRRYDAVLFMGPSGAGKGTLLTHLLQTFPDKFCLSVSHTTRKPRPHETDGVDYYFVTDDVMNTMVANDEFLEHAHVHTSQYGTSRGEIKRINAEGAAGGTDAQGRSRSSTSTSRASARSAGRSTR